MAVPSKPLPPEDGREASPSAASPSNSASGRSRPHPGSGQSGGGSSVEPLLDLSRDGLVAILDTIDEGIHAVDLTGRTAVYNRAASRLDGLAQEDVIGKHVLEAFPSLEHSTSTLLQVLESGRPIYNQPQTYTNYRGVKVHTVNTTLPILSAGRLVGALEIAKDYTQVKRLSEQLLDLQVQVAGGRAGSASSGGAGLPGRVTGSAGRSARATTTGGSTRGSSGAVYLFSHFLTQHPPLIDAKRQAERVAQTSSPVLIYGETGTGKELFVQAIHNASPRRPAPFLAINCAALPASLLEGILFGTVRGSFTGAEDRAGMFELADGGTLFLDEIQSMPLELQAKLLRVLQEGDVMRVGDVRVRRVDVRVVAAMNEHPEAAIAAGRLRPDLYYRINVVRFDLPPLRERREDLNLLMDHFLRKWNGRLGTAVTGIDPDAHRTLSAYAWPGNVRELENAIESALNLATGDTIRLADLPPHLRAFAEGREGLREEGERGDTVRGPATAADAVHASRGRDHRGDGREAADGPQAHEGAVASREQAARPKPPAEWAEALEASGMGGFWTAISRGEAPEVAWKEMLSAFERIMLSRALTAAGGNVKQAARMLGMPRQTLQYRLRQLGVLRQLSVHGE